MTQTYETLAIKYEAINAERIVNNRMHTAEKISDREWMNTCDALVKKFAGWRRSAITLLAKKCGYTYREMAGILVNTEDHNIYYDWIKL